MTYNLILWLFYFVFCAVCFNNDHQQATEQTAGTGFFGKAPKEFPLSSNCSTVTLKADPNEIIEYKKISAAEYTLLSNTELEKSSLFTGYHSGINASLLVVERWESSTLNENSSYNSSTTNLNSENITNPRKLKANVCETLLFGLNADGRRK
ncbi:MAG: hypothetical protein H7Y07_14405 [Pyrinomonadaceae bacterium]|nr:hypothetical protein [Sphingobacteriaceae bacterium]